MVLSSVRKIKFTIPTPPLKTIPHPPPPSFLFVEGTVDSLLTDTFIRRSTSRGYSKLCMSRTPLRQTFSAVPTVSVLERIHHIHVLLFSLGRIVGESEASLWRPLSLVSASPLRSWIRCGLFCVWIRCNCRLATIREKSRKDKNFSRSGKSQGIF